jgi:hypothetical protein
MKHKGNTASPNKTIASLPFGLNYGGTLMQTSSLSSLSRHKSVRVFYLFPSRLFNFPSIQSIDLTNAPSPTSRTRAPGHHLLFRILPSYTVPQVTPSVLRPHAVDMSLLLIAPFNFGTENLFSSIIPDHHLAFAISRISGEILACGSFRVCFCLLGGLFWP